MPCCHYAILASAREKAREKARENATRDRKPYDGEKTGGRSELWMFIIIGFIMWGAVVLPTPYIAILAVAAIMSCISLWLATVREKRHMDSHEVLAFANSKLWKLGVTWAVAMAVTILFPWQSWLFL